MGCCCVLKIVMVCRRRRFLKNVDIGHIDCISLSRDGMFVVLSAVCVCVCVFLNIRSTPVLLWYCAVRWIGCCYSFTYSGLFAVVVVFENLSSDCGIFFLMLLLLLPLLFAFDKSMVVVECMCVAVLWYCCGCMTLRRRLAQRHMHSL